MNATRARCNWLGDFSKSALSGIRLTSLIIDTHDFTVANITVCDHVAYCSLWLIFDLLSSPFD